MRGAVRALGLAALHYFQIEGEGEAAEELLAVMDAGAPRLLEAGLEPAGHAAGREA